MLSCAAPLHRLLCRRVDGLKSLISTARAAGGGMKKLLPGGSAGPDGRAQQAELEDSELEKVSKVSMKFFSEQMCLPEFKFAML